MVYSQTNDVIPPSQVSNETRCAVHNAFSLEHTEQALRIYSLYSRSARHRMVSLCFTSHLPCFVTCEVGSALRSGLVLGQQPTL